MVKVKNKMFVDYDSLLKNILDLGHELGAIFKLFSFKSMLKYKIS